MPIFFLYVTFNAT